MHDSRQRRIREPLNFAFARNVWRPRATAAIEAVASRATRGKYLPSLKQSSE
jgi:hypothetical protein